MWFFFTKILIFPKRAVNKECFFNLCLSLSHSFNRAINLSTGMHSSRMRTACSLTASRSIRRGRGVCMPRMPPVNRMTDACENITLPQTSFTGGNYVSKLVVSNWNLGVLQHCPTNCLFKLSKYQCMETPHHLLMGHGMSNINQKPKGRVDWNIEPNIYNF